MPTAQRPPIAETPPRLRVLREVARDRKNVIPALLLALLATGTTLSVPMVVRGIVDGFAAHRSVTGPVLAMTGLAVGGAVAAALSAFCLARAGEMTVLTVRQRIVAHTLGLSLRDARTMGSGELVARVTSDSAQLRSVVDIGVTQLPMAGLTVAATLIIMGLLDWILLLVVVGTFSVAALAIMVFVKGIRHSTDAQQEALGDLAQQFTSALGALPTVKAYRAEPQVSARIQQSAGTAATAAVSAAGRQAFVTPIMGLGQQFALVGVVLGSGARLASGALSVAEFAAFLLYLLQLVAPLTLVANGFARLQLGMAAGARIAAVLGTAPESGAEGAEQRTGQGSEQTTEQGAERSTVPAGSDLPQASRLPQPAVEFDRVTFSHNGEQLAVDGLSFSAPPRGITALVGPSGAGKTTALSLVERFLDPDSGSVRVLGEDTVRWKLDALRSQVTYLDQAFTLLEGTVRENLQLGRDVALSDEALYAALAAVGLDDAVALLPEGLDTTVGRADDLSGGQRQRLALARALLTDTPVVLLDEPSSQLDSINEHRLRDVVERLARDRAVVMVAHRISTIRHADHVVVLDQGRRLDAGTHDELMGRCAKYQELVRGQWLGAEAGAVA